MAALLVVVGLVAAIAFVLVSRNGEPGQTPQTGQTDEEQATVTTPSEPVLLTEPATTGDPPAPDGLQVASVTGDGDTAVVSWQDDDPAGDTVYHVVVYTPDATEVWPATASPTRVELAADTPVCVEVVALDTRWRRSDASCANGGDAAELVVHDEL